MILRRDVLKLAGYGAFALAGDVATFARAQSGAERRPFDHGYVLDLARELAKKPFKAPAVDLPDPFASLSYDQYVGIRRKPEGLVYATDNIGFVIEPLHRGFLFAAVMDIYLVEQGVAQKLGYEAAKFDFGRIQPPANAADIGFSGFRVLQPRDGEGLQELAIFQGASFFRSLARGQTPGAMARALCVRTADPRGEEFPQIRAVWIERPTLASATLAIHALIDSDSVAGAYRFTLHPSEATIIDTECTLFARAALDHVGIGGMSASYLFGAVDRRRSEDIRPGVYEANGLQMLNGRGEWLWRPVANRETLQVSSFADANPRGFGFLQRDRNFDHFQDDDQQWERRPSLWIEPIDDWGEGAVVLVEIPSESEVNDNLIAYWRPKSAIPAGASAAFSYRQFWCWDPPERPALAIVVQSRGGRAGQSKRRRFLVDFTGDAIADGSKIADVKPALTAQPGNVTQLRTLYSRNRKTFRVLFEVDPAGENMSEIRLLLEIGGKPASETWLYRWTA